MYLPTQQIVRLLQANLLCFLLAGFYIVSENEKLLNTQNTGPRGGCVCMSVLVVVAGCGNHFDRTSCEGRFTGKVYHLGNSGQAHTQTHTHKLPYKLSLLPPAVFGCPRTKHINTFKATTQICTTPPENHRLVLSP